MPYRVKNITEQVFSFEGIVLQPGEVSGELMLDVYQKVLALNYGTILLPVEDEEIAPVEPVVVEPAPEPVVETVVIPEPVVETVSETQTVEVPAAAVAAEPVVEAPKKRGRPRKNQ